MDLQKTLKVLKEILEEEKDFEVQNLLTKLREVYQQSAAGNVIPEAMEMLKAALTNSKFNDFVPSEVKILETLGAKEFVGSWLFEKVEATAQNSYHPNLVVEELNKLIQRRTELINQVTKSSESLSALGVIAGEEDDSEKGQIGILLPQSLTQDQLPEVTKRLEEWNRLIKTLHELCGEGATDAKISGVSKGSIWVFSPETLQCLALVAFIIRQLTAAAKDRQDMEFARQKYENEWRADKELSERLRKLEKELAMNKIEAIVEELLEKEEVTITLQDDAAKNDVKQRLRNAINDLTSSMDKGMVVEVKPPKPPEKLSPDETDEAKKKHELINERIKTVRGVIGITRDIASGLIDFSKLLALPGPEETADVTSAPPPTTPLDVSDVDGINTNIG